MLYYRCNEQMFDYVSEPIFFIFVRINQLMPMLPKLKLLLGSHLFVFVSGVIVGKQIDSEELAGYRNVHEESKRRWMKRAFLVGTGLSSFILFLHGIRSLRGPKKSVTL